MTTFRLDITTPLKAYPSREVLAVQVPAESGQLTVLAGHQPMICAISSGKARIRDSRGHEEDWTLSAGTLIVTPEGSILLVQRAEPAPERLCSSGSVSL